MLYNNFATSLAFRTLGSGAAAACSLLATLPCFGQARSEQSAAPALGATAPSAPPAGAATREAPAVYGLGLSLSGGLNVSHPFLGAEVGWRFERAPFFEVFLDYSYGWPISAFPFHTAGAGVRTRFATLGNVTVFHEALLAIAVSGGGSVDAPHRDLGERLLGAFVTQGLGAEYAFGGNWCAGLAVTTGYPVWLRSELALRHSF